MNNLSTKYTPNPPSFKRIAAKNIDPATGASTWALGSHRWTKKIGNLTKKANKRQTKYTLHHLLSSLTLERVIILKSELSNKIKIKTKNGSDAIKV